jgi:D-alanyl-D-alanine carboxypeptidase
LTDYAILVNKQNKLSFDDIPRDLVPLKIPFDAPIDDPKRLMRRNAAKAAKQLFHRSASCGLNLYGISGYRSFERQKEIYNHSMRAKGREHTEKFIAPPGCSEHQTGLSLDVSCPSLDFDLVEEFEQTKEGIWLKQYAPLYGFILRYPKGKESITGFAYEPWHIRYVTKSLSLYLSITDLVLEEYCDIKDAK